MIMLVGVKQTKTKTKAFELKLKPSNFCILQKLILFLERKNFVLLNQLLQASQLVY